MYICNSCQKAEKCCHEEDYNVICQECCKQSRIIEDCEHEFDWDCGGFCEKCGEDGLEVTINAFQENE